MELWQIDVMSVPHLVDGMHLQLVTGLDDHSRFCVLAKLLLRATAKQICDAFLEALNLYGIPEEVLTDNGKVFTGRLHRMPTNVLFDRICVNNGILHILTAEPPSLVRCRPLVGPDKSEGILEQNGHFPKHPNFRHERSLQLFTETGPSRATFPSEQ